MYDYYLIPLPRVSKWNRPIFDHSEVKIDLYKYAIFYHNKDLDTPNTAASFLHAFLRSFTVYRRREHRIKEKHAKTTRRFKIYHAVQEL